MNSDICPSSKLANICAYFIIRRVSGGVLVVLCDCRVAGTQNKCTDCFQAISGINMAYSTDESCQSIYSVRRLDTTTLHPLKNPLLGFIFQYLLWMIYWNVYLLWFTKSLYWVKLLHYLKIVFCFMLVVSCKASCAWFIYISYSVKCKHFAQNGNFFQCVWFTNCR